MLAQISAPHFTAGIVLEQDVVIRAAPIVGYMADKSWTREQVRAYCLQKKWTIRVVDVN